MTWLINEKQKCAVCGTTHEYKIVASTNCFGTADLDTRPAQMKRSTMNFWIQECPECGYVSYKISDETDITEEFLQSEDFKKSDEIHFKSELAGRFYKHYKINMLENRTEDAFWALLHAAWACDDDNDSANAVCCRVKALPILSKLIDNNKGNKQYTDELVLIKVDVLRRAGLFETLLTDYSKYNCENEKMKKILAFQIERTKEGDNTCYTIENALMNNVEPQSLMTENQLNAYVYPEDVLEPIYVYHVVDGVEGLILEREYIALPDKCKQRCHLASNEELKGKRLGRYRGVKFFLDHFCRVRKGIPWLKDESHFHDK